MKTLIRSTLALVIAAIFIPLFVQQVNAQSYERVGRERIIEFDSNITISEDGSMLVQEQITVEATGSQIRRGIYRDFPTGYNSALGIRQSTGFDIIEILRDGRREPYHTENLTNGTRVYIGDEDIFLQPGIYSYTLRYKTDRQIGYFDDHDELFYNITGNGWVFPIEEATATIKFPDNFDLTDLNAYAYTGPSGTRGDDYSVDVSDTNQGPVIVYRTTSFLSSYEGLTVVIEWPNDLIPQPTVTQNVIRLLIDNIFILAGCFWLIALMVFGLITWIIVGRDPEQGVLVPIFDAPEDISPAQITYLDRMHFDNKSLSAAIISMAVKGYLTIEEVGSKYKIVKKDESVSDKLSEDEQILARKFLSGSSFTFKNTNHSTVSSANKELKEYLAKTWGGKLVKINGSLVTLAVLIALAAGAFMVLLPATIYGGEDAFGLGFTALMFGGGGIAILSTIKHKLNIFTYKLTCSGLMEGCGVLMSCMFVGFFLLVFIFGLTAAVGLIPMLGALAIMVVLAWYIPAIKARTKAGRALYDKVLGFKMFLTATEKTRMEVMHKELPKTLETYEKYLPYAVALGIEADWTKQFKSELDKATEAGKQTGYVPYWYVGSSFNSSGFSSSLSSTIASAGVAPGSSSGGGGFSGGGGGGGGGGGW